MRNESKQCAIEQRLALVKGTSSSSYSSRLSPAIVCQTQISTCRSRSIRSQRFHGAHEGIRCMPTLRMRILSTPEHPLSRLLVSSAVLKSWPHKSPFAPPSPVSACLVRSLHLSLHSRSAPLLSLRLLLPSRHQARAAWHCRRVGSKRHRWVTGVLFPWGTGMIWGRKTRTPPTKLGPLQSTTTPTLDAFKYANHPYPSWPRGPKKMRRS
eukprot:749168-Hanusia_phi.AAC.2